MNFVKAIRRVSFAILALFSACLRLVFGATPAPTEVKDGGAPTLHPGLVQHAPGHASDEATLEASPYLRLHRVKSDAPMIAVEVGSGLHHSALLWRQTVSPGPGPIAPLLMTSSSCSNCGGCESCSCFFSCSSCSTSCTCAA